MKAESDFRPSPARRRTIPFLLIALAAATTAAAQSGNVRVGAGSGHRAAPPSDDRVTCPLTIAEAPEMANLRLGMSLSDALVRLPGATVSPADELGVSTMYVELPPERQSATGISNLTLEFTDGRLSYIRVGYPATRRWNSMDEFLAATAARLNLSGTWDYFYDRAEKSFRDLEDFRDKSLECRGFRVSVGLGVEGIGPQMPHIKLEDTVAQRLVKAREEERRPPPKP